VNVPIGAIAVLITFTQIAKSEDLRSRQIDWVGFITFSVSLFLLVFALVRGNDFGWGSATTISLLVGAAVLMVGFFVNERFTADPMLDLGLFKIPAFVGSRRWPFAWRRRSSQCSCTSRSTSRTTWATARWLQGCGSSR